MEAARFESHEARAALDACRAELMLQREATEAAQAAERAARREAQQAAEGAAEQAAARAELRAEQLKLRQANAQAPLLAPRSPAPCGPPMPAALLPLTRTHGLPQMHALLGRLRSRLGDGAEAEGSEAAALMLSRASSPRASPRVASPPARGVGGGGSLGGSPPRGRSPHGSPVRPGGGRPVEAWGSTPPDGAARPAGEAQRRADADANGVAAAGAVEASTREAPPSVPPSAPPSARGGGAEVRGGCAEARRAAATTPRRVAAATPGERALRAAREAARGGAKLAPRRAAPHPHPAAAPAPSAQTRTAGRTTARPGAMPTAAARVRSAEPPRSAPTANHAGGRTREAAATPATGGGGGDEPLGVAAEAVVPLLVPVERTAEVQEPWYAEATDASSPPSAMGGGATPAVAGSAGRLTAERLLEIERRAFGM